MARLVSVNVGLPRDIAWRGNTVHTSVWKAPVAGRQMVRRLNVEGDRQGDLAGHGGEQRAVLVYQIASYRYWEGQLHRSGFTFGQFGEGPVVLLGAGVGATPLMAMLHALSEEPGRNVWWLYGARDGDDHPFREESRDLLRALGGRGHVRYSRPRAEDRLGIDYHAPGRLTAAALEDAGVPRDANFYLCGPPAFLRDLTAGLARWGVAHDRVHTEVFGPGEPRTPGIASSSALTPHPPPGPPGTGPLVSFARSGLAVRWNPSFGSLLELAEACGVPVKWACRTGVCHSCESGLVSGSIAYDPEPLDAPAAGNLLICCSRPIGEVAIDV